MVVSITTTNILNSYIHQIIFHLLDDMCQQAFMM